MHLSFSPPSLPPLPSPSLCEYGCVYIYLYAYVWLRAYLRRWLRVGIRVCENECVILAHECARIAACMCPNGCVYVFKYVCAWLFVCARYMHACMWQPIYLRVHVCVRIALLVGLRMAACMCI